MPVGVNVPVLVGVVPLFYVQSMQISEGYQRVERIAGSKFSQAITPTTKTISIEALLIGGERLLLKKALEAMALTSRQLVSTAAPRLGSGGIPVISGLAISLDMHITDLRFSQSVQNRNALNVSISLQHVPRSSLAMILSEVADLALAAGTLAIPTGPAASPIPRTPQLGEITSV
jgi:hypothetical protein